MGSDHLGDHVPADTMYRVEAETHFGWPYCFQSGPRKLPDPKLNARSAKMNCSRVPAAFAAFDAHSSPLGLEYFDERQSHELKNSFFFGLHGSTKKQLKRGYRVVRLTTDDSLTRTPEDFINGFLQGLKVRGRPVDILNYGPNAFLLTDDFAGVVYYVYKK